MTVTLRGLRTAVPPTVLIQEQVRDVFAAQPGLSRLAQRIVPTSFDVSGIETRHTVIDELTFDDVDREREFFDPSSGELLMPGTKARNELYIREATRLYVEAGRLALDALDDVAASDVTHVITVCCTGFYAPGPDYVLVRDLGLDLAVQRFHLGFMGCYAAMPRAAPGRSSSARPTPDAVVLVVSVELCTLHLRSSNDPDTIVASSLFADGAGARASSAVAHAGRRGAARSSSTRFETAHHAGRRGRHGLEDRRPRLRDGALDATCRTSSSEHIDERHRAAAGPGGRARGRCGRRASRTGRSTRAGAASSTRWRSTLALSEAQLVPARETLRDYGNMSSATVAFVLRHILDGAAGTATRVLAMAFGPGLTVETGLLTVLEG